MLNKFSAIAVNIGLCIALLESNAVLSQTVDCSAFSIGVDQAVCQNPSIGQQKANYEKLLMQLRRANPGSHDHILAINRQKMQDLNAQCNTADCVSAWYRIQTEALHKGTWATSQQRPSTAVAQSPVAPEPAIQAAAAPQPSPEPAPSSQEPVVQSPPTTQPIQWEAPQRDQMTSTADDEGGAEAAAFRAWQASQAKEPEIPTQSSAVQTPERSPQVQPANPLKPEAPFDIGFFFSMLFTVLIGLPLAYPIWKLVVYLDQYMISRAERYHRPAAHIFFAQIIGSIIFGLIIGFCVVGFFLAGWEVIFK